MGAFPSFTDDALVKFAHSLLRLVPSSVAGQRQIGEHEVDWRESTIEMLISFGESLVELCSDFLALKRSRGRKDGQFGHGRESIETLPGGGSVEFVRQESKSLFRNHANICAKVLRRQTEFDLQKVNTEQAKGCKDEPFAFAA